VCLLRGTDWVFIYNSTFCPHSVFMCFVWIWEQTAIISLHSMCRLVFVMQTRYVCQDFYPDASLSSLYHYNILFSSLLSSSFLTPVYFCFTFFTIRWHPLSTITLQFHSYYQLPGKWKPTLRNKTLLHSWSKCNILTYDALHTGGWVETFRRDTAFTFLIMATLGRTQQKDW